MAGLRSHMVRGTAGSRTQVSRLWCHVSPNNCLILPTHHLRIAVVVLIMVIAVMLGDTTIPTTTNNNSNRDTHIVLLWGVRAWTKHVT